MRVTQSTFFPLPWLVGAPRRQISLSHIWQHGKPSCWLLDHHCALRHQKKEVTECAVGINVISEQHYLSMILKSERLLFLEESRQLM